MMDIDSDYAQLLPIRGDIFPTFAEDQEAAARAIFAGIARHVGKRKVEAIIELGCGTAEILDSIRRQLVASGGSQVRSVGVDCCSAEIALARKMRIECEFIDERAEEFVRSLAINPSGFTRTASTLLLCVGHTISHFHAMEQFLNDLARWRPGLVLLDFYGNWDTVIRQLHGPNAQPVQQLKQARHSSNGKPVTYALTTKRDPEDNDRVLRGIEALGGSNAVFSSFWTSQYRKCSGWFTTEMERRGYALAQSLSYSGGYGPMKGFLLSHN
jgi:hypothetical protein